MEFLFMELKQLEYFLTISKLKSFTLAADQLYISQPGITSAIRRLEDELGINLFAKNRKTAILTPEGQVFANHIERIMTDVSTALNKVEELKNLNTGMILIGISPSTSVSVASFLLAKFKNIYPTLNLVLIEDSSSNLKKMLEEDKLDLAFLILEHTIESLNTIVLGKQDLVVGLPAFHLLKGKTSLSFSSLKNEQFVLLKDGCPIHQMILAEFQAANITPKISFESNYIQAIKRLVLCGAGITILPSEALENDTSFAIVPLENPLSFSIYLAHQKNKTLSCAAQTLYDFINSSCTA